MKKLKVSDVYTRFIVNVEEYGIFNWMARDVTSGGAVYYPLIQDFIDSLKLNVSSELNMGKPEMYLKKNNIIVE